MTKASHLPHLSRSLEQGKFGIVRDKDKDIKGFYYKDFIGYYHSDRNDIDIWYGIYVYLFEFKHDIFLEASHFEWEREATNEEKIELVEWMIKSQ